MVKTFSKLMYPSMSNMNHHKEMLFSLISTCILYFRLGTNLNIYNSSRKLNTTKNQIKCKRNTRHTRTLNPNDHFVIIFFLVCVFLSRKQMKNCHSSSKFYCARVTTCLLAAKILEV